MGEHTDLHAQGYFVYDSKKSGAQTVSHLRFSRAPIRSTYLITEADFVACHQFGFLTTRDVLSVAKPGATFLLNAPFPADEVWDVLPEPVQRTILDRRLKVYAIDAHRVARELGLGGRINTIMQPCFFALMDVMPLAKAIDALKAAVSEAYGKRGPDVVTKNHAAIDAAAGHLFRVHVPAEVPASDGALLALAMHGAPDFVEKVTSRLMAGQGNQLPVSAFPADGTFPTGTSRFEKRCIAQELPVWDPEICIDCGHCVIVCPHAAIRMKAYEPEVLAGAPEGFATKPFHAKEVQGHQLTIQVYPDDCTGCGVCVDVCPVKSKTEVKHKALNLEPAGAQLERERTNLEFFETIPELDRSLMDPSTVKGSQLRDPLFEFSGACAGCGETPYLKLLTQLFGDRIVVANATGCSSIYGGNLPTTPWTVNQDGRGPAWANSLFEDNAEFGLGMRLAYDKLSERARMLLSEIGELVGPDLARAILDAEVETEAELGAQRDLIAKLKTRLQSVEDDRSKELLELADMLVPRSVWIVGGDGWAYDIGSAGLDHVLASGRNVNILVLDTEVYSNTGGQASKATPRGAIAKFASQGKSTIKKDLGLIAASYGNVYVAQIALGANYTQTIKAFQEAAAWPGPSLIIAYSTCIAHGIEMSSSMSHQKDAVKSGYWPLFRYHPGLGEEARPFRLDSKAPSISLRDFVSSEARFTMLARSSPERAKRLMDLAQSDIDERWRFYEQMAGVERTMPETEGDDHGRPND
jgi:pyruvate-ferredoxin/flavodoxin oxidoreductase